MSNDWWLCLTAIAAIAGAAALGFFNPRKLPGPSRLSISESPAVILRIIGLSLGTWALSILVMGWLHQLNLRQHVQPDSATLSDRETVIFSGATELAVLATMLISTVVNRRDGIRLTGINAGRIPGGVAMGIVGIVIVLPLIICVNAYTEWSLHRLGRSPPPHQLLEILKSNPPFWLRAADVIAAVVIAPIAEEMFFRGVLQTFFRYFFKRSWLAIILAGAAFAMVHQWWTWPQIFFLGFCLGYAYERTGNLWTAITMHALFNLTSIYVFTRWG